MQVTNRKFDGMPVEQQIRLERTVKRLVEDVFCLKNTVCGVTEDTVVKLIKASSVENMSYFWIDEPERDAETGMVQGERGYQVDSDELYEYDGASWVFISKSDNIDVEARIVYADEEDITNTNSKLKFKNRDKSGEQLGYKIIRQDFDFENIPLGYDNAIWEIRYLHDLGGANVTFPANVTLRFNGGVITNYGTLTGDNTRIDASLNKIFDLSGSKSGTWKVEAYYPQWFGIKGDGTDTTQITSAINWAGDKSKIVFVSGNYRGFDNERNDMTFVFEEGAVFSSTVHIAIQNNDSLTCKNVRAIGTIVTADRVGTYNCLNVNIDKIHQLDNSRGVHFYFNTKNLKVGEIIVDGVTNINTEEDTCLIIDSATGKGATENVHIGLFVAKSPTNGAFAALDLTFNDNISSGVVVDKMIVSEVDYAVVCTGDGTNTDGHFIGSVSARSINNDVVFTNNTIGLRVGEIYGNHIGGTCFRNSNTTKDIRIDYIKGKDLGENVVLSDDRRSGLMISNIEDGVLGHVILENVLGSQAMYYYNSLGSTFEIGGLSILNPAVRGFVPTASCKDLKIGSLKIRSSDLDGVKGVSSSVIENVYIDELVLISCGGNGLYLEDCTIIDLIIKRLLSKSNTDNGVYIRNPTNPVSNLLIDKIIVKVNTGHGMFLEDQTDNIILNNFVSSANDQGLRVIDVVGLTIANGHIHGNSEGISKGGINTGWLVSGLRVDANTLNGTLPVDVVTGNVIS